MPRITGKDAEGLMAAYAKVHAPKDEVVEEQPTQEGDVKELQEDQEQLNELGGLGLGGLMKRTPQQQNAGGGGGQQSFGQRQIAKAKMRGNPRLQAQARQGTPVNQLFNKGGPQQQQQQQKPGLGSRIKSGLAGGLSKLGNLAGKAVGGLKRVAGGVADKLTGDRFDFDKRGPSGGGNAQSGGQQSTGVKPTSQQVQTAKADTTSPAAKAGISADMRAQAAAKHADFQAKRASQSPTDRRNERLAAIKNRGRPLARLNNEYDSMADVYDDTVNFLVSEGYTEEQSLAIMAEPMFIEAFKEGFLEVLNEQKEV